MNYLGRIVYFISFPLSFIGFIFPIYASSIGANAMEIAYLYSIFSVISILIRPVVGNLIDKKGRKAGILIGTILYAIVNLFFIFANDIKYLLVARIIQSLAASFLWLSVDTFIYDISDNTNRGKEFGSLNQTISKGEMIGSFIGFTIFFNNFSDSPFKLIFSIFMVTSLLAVYYTVREIPNNTNIKKQAEDINIKNPKEFKIFLFIMAIISFVSSLTAPIYLLYLQDNISRDMGLIVFLFLPASILSMFLPKLLGSISDKYNRAKIVLAGMLINAILQLFIPLNTSYYSFMVLYTIISLVSMFYGPAFSSLVIDFVGENKRGKFYGVYSCVNGIAASIGYVVGSYIYENIGNDIVFYTKGLLLVVITLVICYFYNKNKAIKNKAINPEIIY